MLIALNLVNLLELLKQWGKFSAILYFFMNDLALEEFFFFYRHKVQISAD